MMRPSRFVRGLALSGALLGLLVGCKVKRGKVPDAEPTPVESPTPGPTSTPAPTPEPSPTPLPEAFVSYRKLDTATLYNGIKVYSDFQSEKGTYANRERVDDSSFSVELTMRVRVPEAHTSLEELSRINPDLPQVLPGLGEVLKQAKVSGFYHALYERKVRSMQAKFNRLDVLLSRHNFYDCETILEAQGLGNGRKALIIQADMDVVADGSDGDRMLRVEETSSTFQPFTSYRWPKRTQNPNEFLAPTEAKLAKFEAEYKQKGLTPQRNVELRDGIADLKLQVGDLKASSFLVARADPFVVIPGFIRLQTGHPFRPEIGDYAVVIHGRNVYPAIFGDVGPSTKVGEASLRICREIDPKSGSARRAENDLKVTYVIFPGTAEKPFGPPDLAHYKQRCEQLLTELAGVGVPVHQWEDIMVPAPSPTPVPTATVAPSPAPDPAPSPSASPEASPVPSPPAEAAPDAGESIPTVP